MKIIVLGDARTGSTKLCSVLAKLFNLSDLEEPWYYNHMPAVNSRNILRVSDILRRDNFVVKFLFHNFMHLADIPQSAHIFPIDLTTIDWTIPDFVLATRRRDITDCFLSFMVALKRNAFVRVTGQSVDTTPIHVDPKKIDIWLKYHSPLSSDKLLDEIQALRKKPIPFFDYEDICDDPVLLRIIQELGVDLVTTDMTIGSLPTEIDYRKVCLNYEEIVQEFKRRNLQ